MEPEMRSRPDPTSRSDFSASGKGADIYELSTADHLLLVATDRISAFDCILPSGIPHKGEVLTQHLGLLV
jgi:phosphoribosylaminoimidazole-succinocarboxamide synthase